MLILSQAQQLVKLKKIMTERIQQQKRKLKDGGEDEEIIEPVFDIRTQEILDKAARMIIKIDQEIT